MKEPEKLSADEKECVRALHRALVEIPSLSHEEGPVVDYVCVYLEDAGMRPKRFENNVWFEWGAGDDVLLLATHLDVVPESADHPYPPFLAVEKDGMVFGRGSVDAKASAATMTEAVIQLAKTGFKPHQGKVVVALTACEEVGGTYNGLERLRSASSMPDPTAALIGEPTNLRPCLAQKGLLILHLIAHGRTAHSARAHLGDNALYHAARDLLTIESFAFEKSDPLLGPPTMTASVIRGGSAHNVVPDRCEITVDIRSTPAYTHEEIVALLEEHLESDIAVHSGRYVPVGTPVGERIASICIEMSEKTPFGSPTASDWIFLKDVPAVKIGPGESGLSHTPNEHIALSELDAAVRLYKRVIRRYFDVNQPAPS